MLRFSIGLPSPSQDIDFREFYTKIDNSALAPQKLAGNTSQAAFDATPGQNCEIWVVDQTTKGQRNELQHVTFRADAKTTVPAPYKLLSATQVRGGLEEGTQQAAAQQPKSETQPFPRDYAAFAKQEGIEQQQPQEPAQSPQGGTSTSAPQPTDPTSGQQQAGDTLSRQQTANRGSSLGGGAAAKTEGAEAAPVAGATPGVKGLSPSQEEGELRRQAKATQQTAVREQQRNFMAQSQQQRAEEQAAEPQQRAQRVANMGQQERAVLEEQARQRGTLPPPPEQQPQQPQQQPQPVQQQPQAESPEQKQQRAVEEADKGQVQEALKTHQQADQEKLAQVEQKAEQPRDPRK